MKFNSFVKISSIITFIIFTLVFIIPMAQAADSGNDAVSDTSMTFHESSTDSKQTEALKDIIHEKIDSDKSSTTPELCISLDEKLQWFFSFEKLDFINDPYENNDYYNYRATFGIHIAL